LPRGATILSVGSAYEYDTHALKDREHMYFWYICDDTAPREDRHIQICTTGHVSPPPEEDEGRFIGTLQLDDEFVVHIFERFAA